MFQLLFVYGSLMSGFSANVFLSDMEFVGYGILYGTKLLYLNKGYPAVIEGKGKVFGEIYRVDSITLKAIDAFEDFFKNLPEKSFYCREKKSVRLLPYRDFLDAWVYFLNPTFLSVEHVEIPSGNWREFIKKFLML